MDIKPSALPASVELPGHLRGPSRMTLRTLSSRGTAQRRFSGFTLLELLVVLVILGLLAGLVAPRMFGNVSKSEVKVARAQIASLETAIENFRLDMGRYPSTEEGLAALVNAPSNDARWSGPYLKKAVPSDPWGHAYQYKQPGDRGDFDLLSLGRDGRAGGSGDDADLTNR
jgi:general secretion pathway protein G